LSRRKDDLTKVPTSEVPVVETERLADESPVLGADAGDPGVPNRRLDTSGKEAALREGDLGATRITSAPGAGATRRNTNRTGVQGGTLIHHLGEAVIPRPVALQEVGGQHEFVAEEPRQLWGRYQVGQMLGRGGMGYVRLVRDLDLGRRVAMKMLHPGEPDSHGLRSALIAEAQTTGQLDHPNIIPVYELGVLPDNHVFYTMKAVSGRTLKDILRELRSGEATVEREFSRRRLLNVFIQICQAINYAHSRGVVHRDLKPDNIMLGAYGELLVVDWGIAYRIGRRDDPLAQPGMVVGTPHYMPPEQAKGEIDKVDGRSDIFSLGVMLYEILTLSTPILETDTERALEAIRSQLAPPRPRVDSGGRPIPEALADICEAAMASAPEDRTPTARQLIGRIEEYLDGSAERERRSVMAASELAVGVQAYDRYVNLRRAFEKLGQEVAARTRQVYRWDAPEKKREIADLRTKHGQLDFQVSQAFSTAANHFHRVLGLEAEHRYARNALATLYLARLEAAEQAGDAEDMVYFSDLVLRFNNPKRGPLLAGKGRVSARSFPDGAPIYLFDFASGMPDTRPEAGRLLGTAPLTVDLPMGMYLLVAQKQGYRDAHQPVFVRAGSHQSTHLSLRGWAAAAQLVGRDGELEVLKMNFDRAIVGRNVRRSLVTGSDGTGKARLLAAFNDYVEQLDEVVLFFFAECHEPHALVPYAPITDALRIRGGIAPDDSLEEVTEKLLTLIENAVQGSGSLTLRDRAHVTGIADRLTWLPGMVKGGREADLGPRAMRERLDKTLLELIRLITQTDGALFLFREVEYLDDASTRILHLAPRFLPNSPVFILGFGSDVGGAAGWDERIHLKPLGDSAVDALLRNLLKGPLPAGLHEHIMTLSAGVPWLVSDGVRRLATSGALTQQAGRWQLDDALEPAFEVTMLEARQQLLGELPSHLADALRVAAVIGDRFWASALEALGVNDPEAVCTELAAREFIRVDPRSRYSDTQAYAFRSLLFREVVYESFTSTTERSVLHGRIAAWMGERLSGDIREVAELALHVEQAQDEAAATRLFSELGDVSRAVGCFGMARECYIRALANCFEPNGREAIEKRIQSVRQMTSPAAVVPPPLDIDDD
jgi:hypothetical protein